MDVKLYRVLFRFLIDRILFRVLSDRVFFDSSVKGFSSGSAVLLAHQCSFSAMSLFFYQIVLFFIKNRYFILKNNLTISLRCFNNKNKQRNTYMIETKNIVLKIYAINSLIYTYHQISDEYIVQFSSILLCWSFFRIKLEAWIQVFSCEYCKIFEEYLC